MCGITGFVDFGKETGANALKNASSYLKHRGPDDEGNFHQSNENYEVGLASRRLAIIDPSQNGHQPMLSVCKNYILIFNGTIYNYKDLREELIGLKHNFRSTSDTEVLLVAYIQWGKDFLTRINGAFAFCIYDKAKNKLIIARDNVGVKPLFYSFQSNFFSFGSELSSLKGYKTDLAISKKSLAFFLKHGYFPNHSSIYKNIKKIVPGEILELDLNTKELSKDQFWEVSEQNNLGKSINETEIIKNSHRLLKNSILSRTIADTKIGVLLSGGFDSATTAAIVQKNSTTPIDTFTIGFEDSNIDESANAKKIAEHLGTNHHEHILKKKEALDTIKNLGKIYDEPMGDSGAIALFAAVKFASKKVKVLLSSEGGDELFAGYSSYTFSKKWFSLVREIPEISLFKLIHPKIPSLLSSKSILGFYNNVNAYFTDDEICRFISPPQTLDLERATNGDNLSKLLYYDLQNYLPEDLLMKADRTCMYWGVENRDAMLDNKLVSYVHQIPEALKLKNNTKKYILKEIAYQYIPKQLLSQPKKGFSIPIEDWLKADLRDFVISELKDSSIYNLVNKDQVNFTLNNFLKNKKGYYRKIWILLSLKLWANEHLVKATS
jgi:asparagine synthase (glutamine-hydrolysing)